MTDPTPASWTPLGKNERRVLGVLVEKAKTTPDNYPLSIASIVAGSNQKSNRAPIMNLDEDDVQISLDNLKSLGRHGRFKAAAVSLSFDMCSMSGWGSTQPKRR